MRELRFFDYNFNVRGALLSKPWLGQVWARSKLRAKPNVQTKDLCLAMGSPLKFSRLSFVI
ncbi:MAG: hypothetical protein OHK0035_15520 [Cyanobacteria bacterium J069]